MLKAAKRGFTLIELLIVIIILTILIGIVVGVSFQSNKNRANDVKMKADMDRVAKKLEEYFADNEQYPAAIYGGTFETDYMKTTPQRPDKTNYTYAVSGTNNSSYTLTTALYNTKDKNADASGNYVLQSTQ
jgi:prepilin-type N-terminal cleavage/methylation domain-containing protein